MENVENAIPDNANDSSSVSTSSTDDVAVTEGNTEQMNTASAAIDEKTRLEQVVTYGYQQIYPEFMKKLKDLSANQLRRAWAAAMLHPLNDKPPRWSYPQEEEIFNQAIKLDEYKFSMLLLGLDRYGVPKGNNSAAVQDTSLQSEDKQAESDIRSDEEPVDAHPTT